MLACFAPHSTKNAVPIHLIKQSEFAVWQKKQSTHARNWLNARQFHAEVGAYSLLPNAIGKIDSVVLCVADAPSFWSVSALPLCLPEGNYIFTGVDADNDEHAIAWGLGAYQFIRYKKSTRQSAKLVFNKKNKVSGVHTIVESIYLVRDLINTPTEEMGPSELAEIAKKLAKENKAQCKQIVGNDLLKQNYPLIHAVGRASDDAPRLVDIRWGNKNHPKVTLVGKGVCFDTGGLDLKNSSGMLLMKKDMGGAAHVLGLARMIMQAKLPIQLRVLIPMVENSVSGNAYRPGDVLTSRKGITVEIGNTDAEGRLVLADALTEAVSDKPRCIINMATLTGAARVALGTELPAMFCNNDKLAEEVVASGEKMSDPMWRMPLYSAYRELIASSIADINNAGADSYGGAITAALFLKEFVPDTIPWLHFDLMAWNLRAKPGRPQGGEAMALRALFDYISRIK